MFSCMKVFKKSMIPQLCGAIILFTSGTIVNFVQCILYLCLRPLNKRLYRKINQYLFLAITLQLIWMVEWWCSMKVIIFMDNRDFDKFCGKEHVLCIMNHVSEIDWLLVSVIGDKMRLLGNVKACIKKSLQYVPVIGWSWMFSEYVPLERSFEKDEEVIRKQVKELTDYPDPMLLVLYPEGTRFTPEKHKASEEYARLNNLPKLKYHLQPRTRGFVTSLSSTEGKVPAIYDVLLAFKEDDPVKPTMMNILLGKCPTAYIYIKRTPTEDLPKSEDELRKFLHDIFVQKDKMKESFIQTGDFFATSGVPRVAPLKLRRRLHSLIDMIVWAIVILLPIMYYLTALLLSGRLLYLSSAICIIIFFMGLLYVTTGAAKSSTYGTANASTFHDKHNNNIEKIK